jgi:hypothetical protein
VTTISAPLLAGLAIATAVVGWVVLTYLIPNVAHSLYRHSLWAIRDELVMGVIEGRVPRTEATRKLLDSIHRTILSADRHTLLYGLLLRRYRRQIGDTSTASQFLGFDKLDDAERAVLQPFLDRYFKCSMWHLALGSPSGWIGSVAVLVFSVFYATSSIVSIVLREALTYRGVWRRTRPPKSIARPEAGGFRRALWSKAKLIVREATRAELAQDATAQSRIRAKQPAHAY